MYLGKAGESSRARDEALAKLGSRKLSPCRTKVPLKDPIAGYISDTAPAGENGVRGSPGVAQIEARCAWKSALVPAFQFNSSRADRRRAAGGKVIQTNSPIRMVSRHALRLGAYTLAAVIFLVPQMLWAQSAGQFEQPPIINATQLLPESALSGPGFHVERQVPTNGAMGQYTIIADASVFQSDAGTYQVQSLNLLKIRLSEIPAIAYLENVSKTGAFAGALAQSAERPVADAANMVIHPMDTVTGLPSGIGSFFGRVTMGAGEIASSASNSFGSGKAAGQTASATMTALGYDDVRRQLAKKLHVDPYSSDPILTKKLNSVAWVMFSARLTVDAAIMAVPASIIISGVEFTNDLVYQEPKGDLIILVQNKLQSYGLSQTEIASFISNSAIPLSLQVSVLTDLDALGDSGPARRSSGAGQRDDGVPGTFPGYFPAYAQSMEPAEESDYRNSGSRGAGCYRSEWHRDSARSGRLRILDAAHRRVCDHSLIARAAKPRAVDSRSDDASRPAATDG